MQQTVDKQVKTTDADSRQQINAGGVGVFARSTIARGPAAEASCRR
jgi:hypothetical protein